MTALNRRLHRLEEGVRRPIREHVRRVADRLGARLPAAEIESIVSDHARDLPRIERRIQELDADGLDAEQIVEQLMTEFATDGRV